MRALFISVSAHWLNFHGSGSVWSTNRRVRRINKGLDPRRRRVCHININTRARRLIFFSSELSGRRALAPRESGEAGSLSQPRDPISLAHIYTLTILE